MNAPLKLIRLRAGFYVTRDAQWRIVRRPFIANARYVWSIEVWSPGEQRWWPCSRTEKLALARANLKEFIAQRAEQE
jgi:hypothetical protein